MLVAVAGVGVIVVVLVPGWGVVDEGEEEMVSGDEVLVCIGEVVELQHTQMFSLG